MKADVEHLRLAAPSLLEQHLDGALEILEIGARRPPRVVGDELEIVAVKGVGNPGFPNKMGRTPGGSPEGRGCRVTGGRGSRFGDGCGGQIVAIARRASAGWGPQSLGEHHWPRVGEHRRCDPVLRMREE